MSFTMLNINIAFFVSLLGMLMFWSHLMTLLCLEGMMLTLFLMMALLSTSFHMNSSHMMPIIMLVLAACEAAVGLSVKCFNNYGSDFIQNLNLLQC